MCYEDPTDSGVGKELLRQEFEKIREKIWRQIYVSWCQRCGSLDRLTLDHIIPLSRGGTNALSNIQVLCVMCHRKKDIKLITSSYRRWSQGKKHSDKIERDTLGG